jgi:hypothetical protein
MIEQKQIHNQTVVTASHQSIEYALLQIIICWSHYFMHGALAFNFFKFQMWWWCLLLVGGVSLSHTVVKIKGDVKIKNYQNDMDDSEESKTIFYIMILIDHSYNYCHNDSIDYYALIILPRNTFPDFIINATKFLSFSEGFKPLQVGRYKKNVQCLYTNNCYLLYYPNSTTSERSVRNTLIWTKDCVD